MFCLWEVRRPRFAFSDPKRERYTWSPQKGLHMVGYTWWATHGLFFLPFLKDVCSKTMCRPPCVALPFVTFRRMSAGKTMCSPCPFDQRREGYTWCATDGGDTSNATQTHLKRTSNAPQTHLKRVQSTECKGGRRHPQGRYEPGHA